ncbi:conserved hypothetical protein [Theileria orientalis strain Shintoku]|uniref:Signal peptide containing protein n=1 Tax=Theileria orientalis strain Shintoku TaxID=869250 RepID=J4C333_THEOR|nr:conserved hypothetical protein [Theileria orientalis strain Shintoku]BAM39741.1 conserved hypothetical protein [Theileria orientalis strain Shintoku]|eukprot:XP_009690042.1 conserved hypothetical protein [Theileria orientalis strain Shintoku]
MRLTILGLLLMLAQLALSMEGTGGEIKNGLEAASTHTNGLQALNLEETEAQAEESAVTITEGDSETANSDATNSTVAESPEPGGKNSESASSTDKEENGSVDDKQAQETESEHPGEPNSQSIPPETGDAQPMEIEPPKACSGDVSDNKTLVLVISSDSQPQTNKHNVCMNDKPVKLHVPVKGYKYAKIKDKEVTIWKAEEEEYAYAISLLFERPVYMDIELFTLAFKRNVRFAMLNGEWKPIPSAEYYESMNRYKEYHKNAKNENSEVVAVNLNGPDEEKLLITNRSPPDNSVKSVEYSPKNGKKIGYVIAEGHIIWMSPRGEDCTVLSTYKRNLAVLVMIEYKDDRPTEFLSYEAKWTEVPKQKYYDKIVELYTM